MIQVYKYAYKAIENETFLYSSNKKNAVIAAATISKIILTFLALYAGFIDQCRNFCVSSNEYSESVLVRYMQTFAIFTSIEIVFSWGMVLYGVHESSDIDSKQQVENHDRNLTENVSVQYIIISNIVETAIFAVYGIVCLIIVPHECSDGPVKDSFCHTVTWVLTVCSIVWAVSVGFVYYNNKAHTESVDS